MLRQRCPQRGHLVSERGLAARQPLELPVQGHELRPARQSIEVTRVPFRTSCKDPLVSTSSGAAHTSNYTTTVVLDKAIVGSALACLLCETAGALVALRELDARAGERRAERGVVGGGGGGLAGDLLQLCDRRGRGRQARAELAHLRGHTCWPLHLLAVGLTIAAAQRPAPV